MLPNDKESDKYSASARAEAERLENQSRMDSLRARERAVLERQAAAAARIEELQRERDLLAKTKKDKE